MYIILVGWSLCLAGWSLFLAALPQPTAIQEFALGKLAGWLAGLLLLWLKLVLAGELVFWSATAQRGPERPREVERG